MQIHLRPPIHQWPTPTAQRPIWTGHQLSLFHPGIVAKYLAAEAVSSRAMPDAPAFCNVVVDQDVYDPLTLTLPRRDAEDRDRLSTQRYPIGRVYADIPVGMQPAIAVGEIASRLASFPAGVDLNRDAVHDAFEGTDAQPTLAAQMDQAVRRLLPSFAAAAPPTFATTMLADEIEIVEQLRGDAPRCAKLYNQAVALFPGAGMTRMSVEPDRVEVPLWSLRWMKPRQRVYVDMADSSPIFVAEDGEPLGDEATLAPRALLMTALLRRPDRCSLFIHGTGGWNYDRITEQWWHNWQGQTLAPMALATADVHLDFPGVPVNSPADVERAVWRAHHLPYNLEREFELTTPLAREKRGLLAHMHDDRDKQRRRAAYERIHQINRDLAAQHPEAIAKATLAVERAKTGVANAEIAGQRDWSFLLYPSEKLETLRQRIAYPLDQPASADPLIRSTNINP